MEYFYSLYNTYLPELANPKAEQLTTNVRVLLLSDFKLVFCLCLLGLAFGFIVFVSEICLFLFNFKFVDDTKRENNLPSESQWRAQSIITTMQTEKYLELLEFIFPD